MEKLIKFFRELKEELWDLDRLIAFTDKVRATRISLAKMPRKILVSYVTPCCAWVTGVSAAFLSLLYAVHQIQEYRWNHCDKLALTSRPGYFIDFFVKTFRSDRVWHEPTVREPYMSFYQGPWQFTSFMVFVIILIGVAIYLYMKYIADLEEHQSFLILLIFNIFCFFLSVFCLGICLSFIDGFVTHNLFNYQVKYDRDFVAFQPYFLPKDLIEIRISVMYFPRELYDEVFIPHSIDCLRAYFSSMPGFFESRGDEIIEQYRRVFPYEYVMNPDSGLLRHQFPQPGEVARLYPEIHPWSVYSTDNVRNAAHLSVNTFLSEDPEVYVVYRDYKEGPCWVWLRVYWAKFLHWRWSRWTKDMEKRVYEERMRTQPDVVEDVQDGYRFDPIMAWYRSDVKRWRVAYGEHKRTWGVAPRFRKHNRYYYGENYYGFKYYNWVDKKGLWPRRRWGYSKRNYPTWDFWSPEQFTNSEEWEKEWKKWEEDKKKKQE